MPADRSPLLEMLQRRLESGSELRLLATRQQPPGDPYPEAELLLSGEMPAVDRLISPDIDLAAELADGPRVWLADAAGVIITLVVTAGATGALPAGPLLIPPVPPAPGDPAAGAARFWVNISLTLAHLSRGRCFAAHGALEAARMQLLDLYRVALLPEAPAGWAALDAFPGDAPQAVQSLRNWVVSPLDSRSQWRCASRLCTAFETLALPLSERLGLPYPWRARNLAFARLSSETRPGS